jgi:hypothetical protein
VLQRNERPEHALDIYCSADPFLRFWFRYVEPNRSRLEAGQTLQTAQDIRKRFPQHLGEAWEELARKAVPHLPQGPTRWLPAARWWGRGVDKKPFELDVVAESIDGASLLVGEAKLRIRAGEWMSLARMLQEKIDRLPFASNCQSIVPMLFVAAGNPPKNLPVKHRQAERILSLLK